MDPNNYTVIEGGQVTVTAVLNREADRPLSVGFFTDDETATGIIEQRICVEATNHITKRSTVICLVNFNE